jgi:Beta-lactamase
MKIKLVKLLIFIFAVGIIACEKESNDIVSNVPYDIGDTTYNYQYEIPEQVDDGFETASLTDVSLNEIYLGQMMDYLEERDHRIHSILILKDKKLVFEEYFSDYQYSTNPPGSNGPFTQFDRNERQFLASETKSITSVVVGLAIDNGFINSVDDKVKDYFPTYDFMTGEKADITIKDMLTMSSGLPFDESTYPYGDERNGVTQLFTSSDPIRWVLEQDMDYSPGTTFFYNSGTTNVLAAIVEEASGMYFYEFLNNNLFFPLGIADEDYLIELLSSGRSFASGGLHMGARDLLKVGYLFLNDGKWGDEQIISEEWITESTDAHIETHGRTLPDAETYGYQWWNRTFSANGNEYECFFSAGWGGQYMFIFPEQDLIIQFFSGYFLTNQTVVPEDLVEDYILPAIND